MVFCCISDIYIIFGSQVCFSCFTGYVAAFNIDIFAARNADIVLRCYSSAFYSLIHLLVMVVIAAATLAYFAFLAVQIFHSSQVHIAFSIQLHAIFCTQNTTCYADVLFSIQADVLAAQRTLLVLHVMDFCRRSAISYGNVLFICYRYDINIVSTQSQILACSQICTFISNVLACLQRKILPSTNRTSCFKLFLVQLLILFFANSCFVSDILRLQQCIHFCTHGATVGNIFLCFNS